MRLEAETLTEIQDYYRRTYWDYRTVWTDREALACHFGYRDAGVRSHREALRRTNARVAERAGLAPGMRVLDAGCGLGGTAIQLAEEHGVEVLGVGLCRRQLARARRGATERGCADRVGFAFADYAAVPEPDASFDAVIAVESLCHAPDPAPFVAEAARLLRPGGRLVVADYMPVRDPADATERRLIAEWKAGWTLGAVAGPERLAALARASGFAEPSLEDVTPRMARSLRRLYRLTYIGWPLSTLFVAAGLRSRRGHANVVASRRQYQALRRGLWRYHHLVAVRA